jgi:23S rRNA (uracil1939-C5)-methyltransferase
MAVEAPVVPPEERVEPFCRHYGRCGGCLVQHWRHDAYLAWKRGLLLAALERARLATEIEPIVDAHGEGRRRVNLHVRRTGGAVTAGFMMARSHTLVDIDRCPILAPMLDRAPDIARALGRIALAPGAPVDVQATATEGGLDVDLRGLPKLDPSVRLALVEAAERLDLARLSRHGEALVERRPPLLAMGRAAVTPPAGGFLQATAAGEAALAACAAAAIPRGAKRVADLFCGVGPFALRFAETAQVLALDSHAPAIEALRRAANHAPGLKPVTASARDLFRLPLRAEEMSGLDAALFDPPRAGAEAQAREIARSKVPVAIAVSCNVDTFARDAAILVSGGYRFVKATPVDQFRHSAHLEVVGVFAR